MPDGKPPSSPQPEKDEPGISPSAMFLEMMRQAARQANVDVDPLNPDLADFIDADEIVHEKKQQTPLVDLPHQEVLTDEIIPDMPVNDLPAAEPPLPPEIVDPVEIEQEFTEPEPEKRVPIYSAPPPKPASSDEGRQEQLEAQRVQRIKRRGERRQRRRAGIIGGFLRTILVAIFASALAATIFTWFTEPEFITPSVASGLQLAQATSVAAAAPLTPTAIPVTPNWLRRVGIIAGHRGPENDPGSVCDDGQTETEINFSVAQMVVRELRARGYSVDLLDEFDARLDSYQAAALVSLHSNDCRDYGEFVSGYLVARASARPSGGPDDILAECIGLYYGRATQIDRRYTLTVDMTDYHNFREIHPLTPAAILEMGFLKDDRVLLTEHQDLMAEAIVNGILCFLNGENPIPQLTATPLAVPTIAPGG